MKTLPEFSPFHLRGRAFVFSPDTCSDTHLSPPPFGTPARTQAPQRCPSAQHGWRRQPRSSQWWQSPCPALGGKSQSGLFPICTSTLRPFQSHPTRLPLHLPGMTAQPRREVLWRRRCLLPGQQGPGSDYQVDKTTEALCLL